MRAVFIAQVLQLRRNPWTFVIMLGLSVLLILFIGGATFDKVTVQAIADASLDEARAELLLEQLNDSDSFAFQLAEEEAVREALAMTDSGLAVHLYPADFLILAATGENNAGLLSVHVGAVYRQELALMAASADPEALRAQVEERLQTPALVITAPEDASGAGFEYDVQVHTLIGMGLFFASFTIMFMVTNLLEDRRLGIWDRVIQSATPRSAMYGGHLSFSFLLGLAQIVVVFLLFHLVFNIDLGQNYLGVLAVISAYTLAIVALGLFLAGLVRNAQQMGIVIPIVAVSSAMLGGAYWPLEIVENPVLLTLSSFTPIRYALDALKGIIYYDYAWSQLLPLIGTLLGFFAVFMMLGLLIIDRRRVR